MRICDRSEAGRADIEFECRAPLTYGQKRTERHDKETMFRCYSFVEPIAVTIGEWQSNRRHSNTHTHTRERAHAGLAIKYKQLAYIAIAGLSSILFIDGMCVKSTNSISAQAAARAEPNANLMASTTTTTGNTKE